MKKNISGIYAIHNKINGKRYIGSSKSVHYRWKGNHLPQLKTNTHYNRHLQSAWNKYGEEAFDFVVLEECTELELLAREGFYIEQFRSWEREYGYNLTRIVDNVVVASQESVDKRLATRYSEDYWTTGANAQILELFHQGMSKNAIANHLHITRSAVYSCLEHHNLHQNTGKGAQVKLTTEVRNNITSLRQQGKTWDEVCAQTGISKTQAYRAGVAGGGGYNTQQTNRKAYRTVTPEVVERVKLLRQQNKKWEEIEDLTGVSRFALHQNGITKLFKPISRNGPRKKMSNEKRAEIIELLNKGMQINKISELTGVPQSTIRLQRDRGNNTQLNQ